MKRTHYLLCAFALTAFALPSCSKDDDDDDNRTTEYEEEEEEYIPVSNPDNFRFYGAELFSKETFKYGKFEAKMKVAYAPGCISSMFLYFNDSYKGGEYQWNEIDIEIIGKNRNAFQSNIITGKASKQITSEEIHNIGSSIDSDYHIYTIEWTPDYVAWFVDNKEMRRTKISNDSKEQVKALIENQSLRFNLWASNDNNWVGYLDPDKIPVTQYIDYVKVYDYDNNTKAFSERWTDDFDSFDSDKWDKGNWEIGVATEKKDNVVVEDGVLKLMLTKEKK